MTAVITTVHHGHATAPVAPPDIALGVHRRPDYGQSHSCPTTLCTYPTRKAGEVFVAGVEWARAINLTYAPGPVLLASHWRPAEPALFGRGQFGQ